MDWLGMVTNAVGDLINKIPIERMIIKEPDNKEDREELKAILKGNNKPKAEPQAEDEITQPASIVRKSHAKIAGPEQTIEYQNREIGKIILQMERHASQKFHINGIACDCGSSKHLLDLEELCEETIPMVDKTEVYYKIIDLGKEIAPKVDPEVVASGRYDSEYPEYSKKYRDLRKELFGTLDFAPLFEKRERANTLIGAVVRNELPSPTETQEVPVETVPEPQT
jgi:hypothetical protein